MPIQTRPADEFSRLNLLFGLPIVYFTPRLASGGFGAQVQLGILASAALQKSLEVLQLERGDSGPITVDREIVSRLEVQFAVETNNFRSDVAQYIFAASSLTTISANSAQQVTNELLSVPTGADAERTFVSLANADLDESSLGASALTCAPISDEAVGTGQGGTFGETTGDFALDYKPLLVADISSLTIGGTDRTGDLVSGTSPLAGEIGVEVGTGATSGQLTFPSGEAPANGAAIVASYTPSHSFANLTDYVLDPLLGRIRFLDVDGATDALRGGQPMHLDYQYNRKASVEMQPFTQRQFDGKAQILQLTDVGINFDWDVPSASIRITDEELTFGSEDFGVGSLILNILDAGAPNRFGTLRLSNETQANA